MSVEEHFTIREIREQPQAVRNTIEDKEQFRRAGEEVAKEKYVRIFITGCGTSYHAGIAACYALSGLAKIPTLPMLASEAPFTLSGLMGSGSLLIAISQSGETTDTLRAVRKAKDTGADILGVTNFSESTLAKESKYLVLTKAGEEKSVLATKTYNAQLAALYAFSIEYSKALGAIDDETAERLWRELNRAPDLIEKVLKTSEEVSKKASKVTKLVRDAFVLGLDVTYPTALEAALKLKEGAGIHSEAFPALEFRHGPISLVDAASLIVALYPPMDRKDVHEALHKVVKECRDAGATIYAVAIEGDEAAREVADFIVEVPSFEGLFLSMLYVVPCQTLTYYTAIAKGLNPDKPRRLVKVVRVE